MAIYLDRNELQIQYTYVHELERTACVGDNLDNLDNLGTLVDSSDGHFALPCNRHVG